MVSVIMCVLYFTCKKTQPVYTKFTNFLHCCHIYDWNVLIATIYLLKY